MQLPFSFQSDAWDLIKPFGDNEFKQLKALRENNDHLKVFFFVFRYQITCNI